MSRCNQKACGVGEVVTLMCNTFQAFEEGFFSLFSPSKDNVNEEMGVHSEFEASLGDMRHCDKTKENMKRALLCLCSEGGWLGGVDLNPICLSSLCSALYIEPAAPPPP